MDDVTRCETVSRREAINAVLDEYVAWRVQQLNDESYSEQFNQEEVWK
jgi:hypothetical protein